MSLHERLNQLVGQKSRAAISRQAGLPENTLSNLLNSKRIPRADALAALAKAMNISLDDLMYSEMPERDSLYPKLNHQQRLLLENLISDFGSRHVREQAIHFALRMAIPDTSLDKIFGQFKLRLSIEAIEALLQPKNLPLRSKTKFAEKMLRQYHSLRYRFITLTHEPKPAKVSPTFQDVVDSNNDLMYENMEYEERIDELEAENEQLLQRIEQLRQKTGAS